MAEANQATVYVRLRGLKPDAVYLEEQSGRQYSGAALMHAGIPLPPFTREYEAYQFSLTELKEAGTLYEKVLLQCRCKCCFSGTGATVKADDHSIFDIPVTPFLHFFI